MIKRNPAVLETIAELDHAMMVAGVREFCLTCIKTEGGCCQGCSNLGSEGCREKPLSCAQWLCTKAKRTFPGFQERMSALAIRRHGYAVAKNFRQESIKAELVQISGVRPRISNPVTW